MSIAEKLTTIAENEQKVFDAGKQAEWSEFWDSYQQNGNRTYYNFAFGYQWTDICFKPKYDIRPTSAMQMFYSCNMTDVQANLDKAGVVMDLSKVTNFRGLVSSSRVTRLGVIDTTGATVLDGIFNSAGFLETVELLILKEDGSQTQGQDRPFANATSLKNITVQGKFGLTFSMQWCPLSKESIYSVVNALLETATGQTLTLPLSTIKTRFETSSGAQDGNTAEEWLTLAASKSNWTISLV